MGLMGSIFNLEYQKLKKKAQIIPIITITAPLTLTSNQIYPNGYITINWTVENPNGGYRLFYSLDSISWHPITNTKLLTYNWIIPESLIDGADVRIKIQSDKFPTAMATVDFTIWGCQFKGGEGTEPSNNDIVVRNDDFDDFSGIEGTEPSNNDIVVRNDDFDDFSGGEDTNPYMLEEIIPLMTDFNLPSGSVTAKVPSVLSGQAGYQAWNAFDRTNATYYYTAVVFGDFDYLEDIDPLDDTTWQWLQYDLGEGLSEIPYSYTLLRGEGLTPSPYSWYLQGSNNNTDWDNIDTQTAVPANGLQEFIISNCTTAYRYFRLLIKDTDTALNRQFLIQEMQIYKRVDL